MRFRNGSEICGQFVRGSGVSVVFVLTPPALQSPPATTVATPETEMPCGLLELLCTVQPTALKSVVPLKLIAPLTVLFRPERRLAIQVGPAPRRAGFRPRFAGLASGSSWLSSPLLRR